MLDEQVTEMLLDAEKCCRKLRTGEENSSPEVSIASEIWHMWRISLKVAKGETKHKRDLVIISEKTGVDVRDLKDFRTAKVNIERIRKGCLRMRIQQEAYKKISLKITNRLKLWHKEKTKGKCEKCSRKFLKCRMKVTEKL